MLLAEGRADNPPVDSLATLSGSDANGSTLAERIKHDIGILIRDDHSLGSRLLVVVSSWTGHTGATVGAHGEMSMRRTTYYHVAF